MKPEVGLEAPAFTLYSSDKNTVSLKDFAGKNVVLLFYPFAFSSVCTRELCDVRDSFAVYNNLHAEVIGISVDSIYTLARFKEDQHLNFLLLSDFNKEVSRAYHCLHETFSYGMRGVSKRAAFVIDGTGIVRYMEVLENPGNVPDFSKITATLSNLG